MVDPEIDSYMDLASDLTHSDHLKSASGMLIAVGFFILLIGFLGCCGACKASTWMLCGVSYFYSEWIR